MARQKINKSESEKDKKERLDIELITKKISKNDKLNWKRSYDKMHRILVTELQPLEEQIINLQVLKIPVFDKITEIRNKLVNECIHPKDMLIHKGNYIECKFCGSKITIQSKNE